MHIYTKLTSFSITFIYSMYNLNVVITCKVKIAHIHNWQGSWSQSDLMDHWIWIFYLVGDMSEIIFCELMQYYTCLGDWVVQLQESSTWRFIHVYCSLFIMVSYHGIFMEPVVAYPGIWSPTRLWGLQLDITLQICYFFQRQYYC